MSASGAGLVNVLRIGLSSGSCIEGDLERRRRDELCDPSVVVGPRAESEVGVEWARDVVGDEVLQRLPCGAANQLADQKAVIERLITRCGARLPPRRLGGQPRRGLLPVEEVVDRHRFLPARDAGGVRQQVAHPDVLLAVGGELGPVRGDRLRQGRAVRDRSASARPARHGLGARPDVDDRVLAPRDGLGRVAWPPQMSTTSSPSMSTAMAAPTSAPLLNSSANASATLSNRASTCPCTAEVMRWNLYRLGSGSHQLS